MAVFLPIDIGPVHSVQRRFPGPTVGREEGLRWSFHRRHGIAHERIDKIKMFVIKRPCLAKKEIEKVLSDYVQFRLLSSPEDERTIDAAMRRYLNAQNEQDIIDKYCDLWETCEFITQNIKAKGGKVGKIAQGLSTHISKKGDAVSKKLVEKNLNLRELYDIRGDIIHNAVESSDLVIKKISVLEQIAYELIKYKIGLDYKGNKVIDEAITCKKN